MAADRYAVLARDCDLTGRELKVLHKFRGDPKPKDPARIKKETATETMSIGAMEKALMDRYVNVCKLGAIDIIN